MKTPIAVQLYSVHEDCKNNLADTLKAIAKMGYDGVELAGLHDRSPAEWTTMLSDNNLRVEGAHVGRELLVPNQLEKTLDTYEAVGCRRLIVPWIGGDDVATLDGWKRFFSFLNTTADAADARGFEIGFHNHALEFHYACGIIPILEMLRACTSLVHFQIDMGWAYFAGADGIALIRSNPGRIRSIHMKPFKADNPAAFLGEDDVPWKTLLPLAAQVGPCDWFVVEHETYADTPLACIQKDLANLRAMGF